MKCQITKRYIDSSTAQRIKYSINDFFSKCDQIGFFMLICLHLLQKSLMENFLFFAVEVVSGFERTDKEN